MFAVPADAPPGELACFAWVFSLEGTLDAPIMRQVEFSPIRVIEIGLRKAYVGAGIAFGNRDRLGVGAQFTPHGQQPRLERRVIQGVQGGSGISFGKTPS